jgi:hypothetical protein
MLRVHLDVGIGALALGSANSNCLDIARIEMVLEPNTIGFENN